VLKASAPAAQAPRASLVQRLSRPLTLGLVAIAAIVLAIEVPSALNLFDDTARTNAQRDRPGRLLLAADSLNVDNDFVLAALSTLPQDARYAVLLPPTPEVAQSQYGIDPLTLQGLGAYMEFMLLPRRRVDPDDAQYVLCYACDTGPWDHRTDWLWRNEHAEAIGKVRP
jgi:hypothetical protein